MRARWPVWLALVAFFVMCGTTVHGVGLVGEVAIGWAAPSAPQVLSHLSPPSDTAVDHGALTVRGTRPMLSVGSWPIAINSYTGGFADWPARAATTLTGRWQVGAGLNVVLGGLFILLAARFLRFHGTEPAAAAVAWLLATDWTFVFYRKVLAGTESLLLAAGLLVVWSMWSRRWKGGVHGTVAIALGVALGLNAKLTFAASLAAWGVTALLMRWDRAALKPPRPVSGWRLATIALTGVLPLLVANAYLATLGDAATRSHDMVGLQLARLTQAAPARESWYNLVCFFGNPNAWLAPALGADPVAPLSALRGLGFLVTVVGVGLEWRARTPTASAALLRFLSVAVPLQVGFLFLANQDLHHLAQATPPLLLLVALAADRAAAEWGPPRSLTRWGVTFLFVLPHVIAGALHLAATDRVLATAPRSSFTEAGQTALLTGLEAAGCTRVTTSDYEIYGTLEVRAPTLTVVHTWAAVANGERDGAGILTVAAGGCYVSIRPTAPMIYDWHPSEADVARAAARAGLETRRLGSLLDEDGSEWAAIYAVSAK